MYFEVLAGIAAGILARFVLPDSPGIGSDTLFGLVGGGLAAFIYKLWGHRIGFDQTDAKTIIAAAFGGFVLVALTRMAGGRRTTSV